MHADDHDAKARGPAVRGDIVFGQGTTGQLTFSRANHDDGYLLVAPGPAKFEETAGRRQLESGMQARRRAALSLTGRKPDSGSRSATAAGQPQCQLRLLLCASSGLRLSEPRIST